MRALLAAVLVLGALAPLAMGQANLPEPTLSVFGEDPGRALTPCANESINVIVNYAPGQTGRPSPAPTAERPEGTQPTRIVFSALNTPSWVTSVTFQPPEVLINMSFSFQTTTATSYRANVTAILAVAPDAPALVREPLVIQAVAEPNGNIPELTATSAEDFKLRATTVGLLNVSSEPRLVVPGGRWATIPFQVRNDGNSDIVAKVNVTVRPENSQVEFLETLELKRGETKQVDVRMRLPWTNAEFGLLTLEATPIVEGEEGASAVAEVDVRGESAVPSIAFPLLVVVLFLVARLRR